MKITFRYSAFAVLAMGIASPVLADNDIKDNEFNPVNTGVPRCPRLRHG